MRQSRNKQGAITDWLQQYINKIKLDFRSTLLVSVYTICSQKWLTLFLCSLLSNGKGPRQVWLFVTEFDYNSVIRGFSSESGCFSPFVGPIPLDEFLLRERLKMHRNGVRAKRMCFGTNEILSASTRASFATSIGPVSSGPRDRRTRCARPGVTDGRTRRVVRGAEWVEGHESVGAKNA